MAPNAARRNETKTATRRRREWLALLDAREWLQYDRVVRHLPFLLFLSGLAALYIHNRHTVERQSRELDAIRKELTELEWYHDTANDELARLSRQSEVADRVAAQGIRELTTPPIIIATTPQGGRRARPEAGVQRAGVYAFPPALGLRPAEGVPANADTDPQSPDPR
jgi:hypothetical protein